MDRPFGATPFANMHAACHGLPVEPKRRLAHAAALHGFDKFRETMRREKGSKRPATITRTSHGKR